MARGQRDKAKERFWRQAVRQWQRSGFTVRDYCAEHGLSEPSFYGWRRVLAERSRQRPRGQKASGTAKLFAPVRLVEDPAAPVATATLEVVCRGGRVVRVGSNVDALALRTVVAALEELPC